MKILPEALADPEDYTSRCFVCGSDDLRRIDRKVAYPEIWIEYRCKKCRTIVGSEDNGPYEGKIWDYVGGEE